MCVHIGHAVVSVKNLHTCLHDSLITILTGLLSKLYQTHNYRKGDVSA